MSMRLFSNVLGSQLRLRTPSLLPPASALVKPYCYRSSISLEKLYPQSNLSIAQAPPKPEDKLDKFNGFIPIEKLEITFSRSSGPGGQNVNKLNTKANIRFKVEEANWIPEIIRNNLKDKFRNHITKDGYIAVQSDRTRYQHLNTADALQKVREMIRASEPEIVEAPSTETLEKLRRKREKAARERLLQKRARGDIKSGRGAV